MLPLLRIPYFPFFSTKPSLSFFLSSAPSPIISLPLDQMNCSCLCILEESKLIFISYQPRALCKTNNIMSMLYVGKMKFKNMGAFSKKPQYVARDRFEPQSNSHALCHDMLFCPLTCYSYHVCYITHKWKNGEFPEGKHIIPIFETLLPEKVLCIKYVLWKSLMNEFWGSYSKPDLENFYGAKYKKWQMVVNFNFSFFKAYRLPHKPSGKCQINLLGELLDPISLAMMWFGGFICLMISLFSE